MYQLNNIINTIIQGHVLNVLKQIPDESIHMCITSPPYWGLRNYSTNPQTWDGDKDCDHEWVEEITSRPNASGGRSNKLFLKRKGKENFQEHVDYHNRISKSNFCIKCDAWIGELGSEPTYQLYINHLMQIFDEIKRILTKDGNCWVNLGDSYAGSNQGSGTKNPTKKQASNRGTNYMNTPNHKSLLSKTDIKSKSLIGIPDRFKITMIDNGWICRNDIVWHKPNQMPSSVKDRFTVDYERIFFFTKNKKYYFEQQFENQNWNGQSGKKNCRNNEVGRSDDANRSMNSGGVNSKGRNKRCVWSINTQPLKDAHFAVFPSDLVETPILAGCPDNGIVLDPFMGSGSTALKALELNKNYIGIELNPEYIEIAERRIKN